MREDREEPLLLETLAIATNAMDAMNRIRWRERPGRTLCDDSNNCDRNAGPDSHPSEEIVVISSVDKVSDHRMAF